MTATMNNVMNDIETLSASEKGLIAKYLIASLDGTQDENSTKAWAELANSRYEEIKNGAVSTVSWESMKASILGGR